jgi:hypothetical protein
MGKKGLNNKYGACASQARPSIGADSRPCLLPPVYIVSFSSCELPISVKNKRIRERERDK